MADNADRANDLALLNVEHLLNARKSIKGESASECEECGNTIPAERQIAIQGVTLCVGCQEILEMNYR